MKILRLILGDQLNINHSWFLSRNPDVTYVMMEIRSETDYTLHHIQKLLGVLGAMRKFAEELSHQGHRVIYLKLNDRDNQQDFFSNLKQIIHKEPFELFEYQQPDEYRVEQLLSLARNNLGIASRMVDSEHFLTHRNELKEFFGSRRYLLENFYRYMRKKHHVLMHGNLPAGNQWNFDKENRKNLPKKILIPPPLEFENNLQQIYDDLKAAGVNHFGQANPERFIWPINRKQSLELLNYFVNFLLPYFGIYQDAMTTDSWSVFHSRLSFALNTKMLHPFEVISSVIETWNSHPESITLPQVEGFIRQILGWREYVRGIYWAEMPEFARLNYFGHHNHLPGFYWDGNTRMNCLKYAIGQSLEKAYAHHIQRLMITGNFALLSQTHPDEVDHWYLGVYIDAFEWVEITNTRGMSQFADGGLLASKPYVSSANYIHKMSNYCKGCYYNPEKRTGEKACPFNSLFWNFFERNHQKLHQNPRLGMIYKNLYNMPPAEKADILKQADYYLNHVNEL